MADVASLEAEVKEFKLQVCFFLSSTFRLASFVFR